MTDSCVARLPVLPECVVYPQGTGFPYCSSVLWLPPLGCFLRSHCRRYHQWYGPQAWSSCLVRSTSLVSSSPSSNFIRRWLFIIEGAITIVVAVIAIFVLPNFPRTTSWLTEEEKALAAWRLEEDIGEDDWVDSEQQSFLHGAKLAFTDIKTYILVNSPSHLHTLHKLTSPTLRRCL